MRFTSLMITACLLAAAPAALAADVTFSVKHLTPEAAIKAAQKAMDTCRAAGHQVAVAVVDRSGITMRHQVGVENMAWSTDFPHHGNDWPYSRKTIDSLFVDVPADERRKIVCTNAGRFWGLIS